MLTNNLFKRLAYYLLCVLFFSSCVFCDIYLDLNAKPKGESFRSDVYFHDEEKWYWLDFFVGTDIKNEQGTYTNDTVNPRLLYVFDIGTPSLPQIRLNSFTFTREKGKDTIPFLMYYKPQYYPYQLKNENVPGFIPIQSLPFSLSNKEVPKQGVKIIMECSETYRQTKTIYISYDIEVAGKRIVKKNIKYSRRLVVDCRPKLF